MDRVKNSMQQVPNAIPKVIRRSGGANSLELEKENFERGQVCSTHTRTHTRTVRLGNVCIASVSVTVDLVAVIAPSGLVHLDGYDGNQVQHA